MRIGLYKTTRWNYIFVSEYSRTFVTWLESEPSGAAAQVGRTESGGLGNDQAVVELKYASEPRETPYELAFEGSFCALRTFGGLATSDSHATPAT